MSKKSLPIFVSSRPSCFAAKPKDMNTLKRITLALALAAGFSSTALLAEPSAHSEHDDKSEKKPRVSRIEKLSAELNLSEDQKAQIAAINKEENAALKVVSDDKALDRSVKMAKNKEIRATHVAKVRALLTAEQQAKFDALNAKSDEKDKKHDEEKH